MERAAGGIFAILFMCLLGVGAYAWTLHSSVDTAQTRAAAAEARAKTAEASAQEITRRVTAGGAALAACQTELEAAKKVAEEAAARRPAGRR